MFCPNCGAPLSEGARFCPNCGTPVEKEGADAAPAPTAKGKTHRPIIIAVAVVAVIALVAGLVIWKGVGRAAKGDGAKTAASAQSVKFDDSTPAAIVTTALRAGMQGKVNTMLKTLTSDQKKKYVHIAWTAYSKAEFYTDLSVGDVESKEDPTVYIVRKGDVEKARSVQVERVKSGGYRISDAEGLWMSLPSVCGHGGYAPLGRYEYSCKADGLTVKAVQRATFSEEGYRNSDSFKFLEGTEVTDWKKVRKALVGYLDYCTKHEILTNYSNVGEPAFSKDDPYEITIPVAASYSSGGSSYTTTSASVWIGDWYELNHPDEYSESSSPMEFN